MRSTLRVGSTAPPDPAVPPNPPSDAIVAAMLLIEAAKPDVVDRAVIDVFASRYPTVVPPRPTRAALEAAAGRAPQVVVRHVSPPSPAPRCCKQRTLARSR